LSAKYGSFDKDYFQEFTSSANPKLKRAICRGFLKSLHIEPVKNGAALDVGCGYGYSSELFLELGYSVTGLDVSPHAVKTAKKFRTSSAEFLICDVQGNVPFKTEFDLVCCFDVLEHLAYPQQTLKRLFGVLKKGGIFIASTPNPLSKSIWNCAFKDPTHINVKRADEWQKILSSSGFSNVQTKTVHFVPIIWKITSKSIFLETNESIGTIILIKATKRLPTDY